MTRKGYGKQVFGASPKTKKKTDNPVNNFNRSDARMKREIAEYLDEPKNAFCALNGKDCNRTADAVDHFRPLSKHPEIDPYNKANWLPACTPCNASKKDIEWEDWIKLQEDKHLITDSEDYLNDLMGKSKRPKPNPQDHLPTKNSDDHWKNFKFN